MVKTRAGCRPLRSPPGEVRRPAEHAQDAVVLFRAQPMLGDDFRGDLGHAGGWCDEFCGPLLANERGLATPLLGLDDVLDAKRNARMSCALTSNSVLAICPSCWMAHAMAIIGAAE
jgi:hypothetical protein